MIRIKVCGITNLDDALAAQAFGADALGFIFAQSPRQVDRKMVSDICESLPPFVQSVGVFVNEDESVVKETAHICGLNVLQLHGQESPEYCAGFERGGPRLIKVFRISRREDLDLLWPYKDVVSAFLLDTHHPGMAGGTGRSFDWSIAAEARKMGPIILAGGLSPENVEEAIRTARPYAVDVSSGVEVSPGKKDYLRMRLFIERARAF